MTAIFKKRAQSSTFAAHLVISYEPFSDLISAICFVGVELLFYYQTVYRTTKYLPNQSDELYLHHKKTGFTALTDKI